MPLFLVLQVFVVEAYFSGETDREDAGECDVIGEGGGDGEVRLLAASLAFLPFSLISA